MRFKQLLARITKCRAPDEIRGRHVYTEERVDLLMEKVQDRLISIEHRLINLKDEYREVQNLLQALYKHNLELVRKYGDVKQS